MSNRNGLHEMALFVVAAAAGIYGLGEGLAGFFEPGHGDVAWLAVAAVALAVLARQMARVQDRWPRRTASPRTHAAGGQTAHPAEGAPTVTSPRPTTQPAKR